jgi:hypothetical protein
VIALAKEDPDEQDVQHDGGPCSEAGWAVLDAIVAGTWAWTAVQSLLAAGHGQVALDEVVVAGLAEQWDLPEDPPADPPVDPLKPLDPRVARRVPPTGASLTLSPYGACRLGVVIDEGGWGDRPYWTLPGAATRSVRVWRYEVPLRMPERIQDRTPGPLEELAMRECRDKDTDRPIVDPATGKTKMTPLTFWGITVPISPKIRGKRGKRAKSPARKLRRAQEAIT